MSNYAYLQGSEDVLKAGGSISAAAAEMKTAAYTIELALARHQQFLDEWLFRLEALTPKDKV